MARSLEVAADKDIVLNVHYGAYPCTGFAPVHSAADDSARADVEGNRLLHLVYTVAIWLRR